MKPWLALLACKKQSVASVDAGTPVMIATSPELDASAPDASLPPQRDDAFHLVARGTPRARR